MHIFIDESGSFTVPRGAPAPSLSCVGAVMLPSDDVEEITAEFLHLSEPWSPPGQEVKGRALGEVEIDAFLAFLARRRCLVHAVAIDLGLHDPTDAAGHREAQADRMTANLTEEHHPSLRGEVAGLANEIRALSDPNYVQFVAYTQLIDGVMRAAMMYVAQRRPSDLGTFDWTLDAKSQPISRMETLWRAVVLPFLQSKSLRDPLPSLDWCDYSALEPFLHDLDDETGYVVGPAPRVQDRTSRPLNLRKVLDQLRFSSSADVVGLQMADIAVNAVRRTLSGNLGPAGWRKLGNVLVEPPKHREAIRMISLFQGTKEWEDAPYFAVLPILRRASLRMIAANAPPP